MPSIMRLFVSAIFQSLSGAVVLLCRAEEYISPDTKLADCLYQCEKTSKANRSANRELKLLFKVSHESINFRFYCTVFVIFTARCTVVQSAVLRSHVVCLSVRLSVSLVDHDHIG